MIGMNRNSCAGARRTPGIADVSSSSTTRASSRASGEPVVRAVAEREVVGRVRPPDVEAVGVTGNTAGSRLRRRTVWMPRGGWSPPRTCVNPTPDPPTVRTPAPAGGAGTTGLRAAALLILVSVGLGVYGRTHQATFFAFNLAGFSSSTAAKAWVVTVAFVFALVQLGSALVIYGKRRVAAPPSIGGLHRWSGRIAVVVSVPVAVTASTRWASRPCRPACSCTPSSAACSTARSSPKMLVLSRKASPSWLLPVLGAWSSRA